MMLALRMGRTLGELGATMSSAEFSLWCELYERDEWGQKQINELADFRTGLQCATIANYAGKVRKPGAGDAKPSDFMPFMDAPEQEEPDPVSFFTAVANSKQFDRKD
jgi:hypothetical protein